MRSLVLLGLLAATVLPSFALPARAQENNPAVIDRGSMVYDVDATHALIPNLLPAEDVERISTLQNEQRWAIPISPISPDDGAALVTWEEGAAFASLADGSTTPVDATALESFYGFTEFAWRDATTLVQAGYLFTHGDEGEELALPRLLLLDRATGAATLAELPPFADELTPVSIAPRAGRLLLIGPAEGDEVPGVRTIRRDHPRHHHVNSPYAKRGEQLRALTRTAPALARRAALAELFDHAAGGVSQSESDVVLATLDIASGTLHELRTFPEGTMIDGLAWGSDEARLAVSTTGLPLAHRGRDGALLSEPLYMDSVGSLAPEANPLLQNNALDIFELNKGEQQSLRAAEGDQTTFGALAWSTDGQTLMVQHRHPSWPAGRRYPVYNPEFAARGSFRFYDTELREVRRLDLPALSSADSWLTHGRFASPDEVIFSAHAGTDTRPWYYNLRSGELRPMTSQPGTAFGITPTSSATRQIIFFHDSFTDPGELMRVGWDGAGLAPITALNDDLRAVSQTQQYGVSFQLGRNQTREGVLILPAGTPFPPKNQRIVVWQEGGPQVSVQNTWSALVERPFALLPNFGFGVLVMPLAGRQGLGAARFTALADGSNFGQVDIDEQAQIVRQMIRRSWAQQGQVGIAGCSYGGYFTTQSLVRHPRLYGAGNAMCSLVDTYTEWSRGFDILMPYLQGLPPYARPEEYRKDSPLYNAAAIRTPLLTFHGREDFLPLTIMENLHTQVVNRGVPAKMLRFAGVGHGFGAQFVASDEGLPSLFESYERYGAQEQIIWFRTYLK
jgi:dipeptidyl aminopeptidase/acylaminoacyl peptidase